MAAETSGLGAGPIACGRSTTATARVRRAPTAEAARMKGCYGILNVTEFEVSEECVMPILDGAAAKCPGQKFAFKQVWPLLMSEAVKAAWR